MPRPFGARMQKGQRGRDAFDRPQVIWLPELGAFVRCLAEADSRALYVRRLTGEPLEP